MAIHESGSRHKTVHRDMKPVTDKLDRLLKDFGKEIMGAARHEFGEDALDVKQLYEMTNENLLNLRRRLIAQIKSGMLERKDREGHIALVAMMIWHVRRQMEKEWPNGE